MKKIVITCSCLVLLVLIFISSVLAINYSYYKNGQKYNFYTIQEHDPWIVKGVKAEKITDGMDYDEAFWILGHPAVYSGSGLPWIRWDTDDGRCLECLINLEYELYNVKLYYKE